VDKQNLERHNGFSASVAANDEDNASRQKLYPGIMCRYTAAAQNRFASTPFGGVV
jgi:hypothetical protein